MSTAGILCVWAHPLSIAGILCGWGWALQGYSAVGRCRDAWWLGTAGILGGWLLKSASSRARTTSTLKSNNPTARVGRNEKREKHQRFSYVSHVFAVFFFCFPFFSAFVFGCFAFSRFSCFFSLPPLKPRQRFNSYRIP